MARDYSKGKIYMIRSKDEDCVPYVGSTTKQYLSQRMVKHRNSFELYKNKKANYTSVFELFEKYGVENCYIELLESCPCKISEELLKKEREWFDKLNCVNIVRPMRTEEEKKEKIKTHNNSEWMKKWREDNKEELKEYMKEYTEKNYDKLLQKKRDYKIKNAEKIKEQIKERYVCGCGVESLLWNKARHNRSKKHQEYLTTVNTLCTTAVTESS